jgi:hypothetical protein
MEKDENGISLTEASFLSSPTDFMAIQMKSCLRMLTPTSGDNYGITADVAYSGRYTVAC